MPLVVRDMDARRRTFKRVVEFAVEFLARAHAAGYFHSTAFLRRRKIGVAHGAGTVTDRNCYRVAYLIRVVGTIGHVTV